MCSSSYNRVSLVLRQIFAPKNSPLDKDHILHRSMVPTWKMGVHFPVIEKSVDFEYTKKSKGILPKMLEK